MTKREQNWMDAICKLGCIVCRREGTQGVRAEPHHLLSGSKRKGHLFSIPLCHTHHRSQIDTEQYTSRHPWKTRFEARYGTEAELLAKVQELLA